MSCINSTFALQNQQVSMQLHYVQRVPLNVLAAAPRRKTGRARKRILDSLKLKFSDLKPLMNARAAQVAGVAASSLPNLHSAIRAFLTERGISESAPVGSVMRASFYDHIRAHVASLREAGRPAAYIANRRSALTQWRRCVLDYDRYCAVELHQARPFQTAISELMSSCASQRTLANASGVPLSTLKRWASGAEPNGRSLQYVPRLERLTGMAPGSLTDLLASRLRPQQEEPIVKIGYRERLREQNRLHYATKQPSARLRREWSDFLQYKVAELDDASGVPLQRSLGGRWSSTLLSDVAPAASNWHSFYRGRHVPTAGVTWTHVSQFLGWLTLDERMGGKGMDPDEALTLASFSRRTLVHEYVEWRQERAGGKVHSGIRGFLMLTSSMCNPRTGYLTQSWARFSAVAGCQSLAEWSTRCSTTFDSTKKLVQRLADDAGTSRDSFAPIQAVLALPNPLDAVADMLARMKVNQRSTGGTLEAIDVRDRLLVKLLASNPLRDKNVRRLTYRDDGTGHLRRDSDGGWSIFVPRRELKNFKGAARERDYHMRVRPEVWPDIERYLRDHRPVLQQVESDVVFVSEEGGPFSPSGLRRRVEKLTREYLHQCPGVGPHAMRHIVATSILKANPNDWATAAWALHDREATVRKHYAHLASRDAELWFGKAMDGPFARM